jgi:hypothetical protein
LDPDPAEQKKNFSGSFFIIFLVIKTLDPKPDPDPYLDSLEMLDPIRIRIQNTDKVVLYFTFDPDLLLNIDGSWTVDGELRQIAKIALGLALSAITFILLKQ